jgi:hypothetical protein
VAKAKTKTITGVEIRRGVIRAPKEQHYQIRQRHADITAASNKVEAEAAARSLLGHLDHVAQIEPKLKSRASGTRALLKASLL